jgi:hypothetical protein
VIKPGQKIHASICFIHGYTPQAIFAKGVTEKGWDNIAGIGRQGSVEWAGEIKEIMEMDLFDHSPANVKLLIEEIKGDMRNTDFVSRLKFIAATRMSTLHRSNLLILRMLHSTSRRSSHYCRCRQRADSIQ